MRTPELVRKDMGDSLPRYYDVDRTNGGYFLSPTQVTEIPTVVGNILDREATEIGQLNADIYDVLNQFFIDTATWGLAYWERVCGIPTDLAKPIEQRRSVIRSRLRGIGTVTVALIKNVAEAYDNGEVEVTENVAAYTIGIKFIANRGVPENLEDTRAALREIIPAHLAIEFSFTYLQWDELDAQGFTWDTLDARLFTWDDFETYRP
ncbi:YmfQ family protein [Paenibacillus naphthalenovorans]|uniref:YmfQ family protein n=1 Tax=Paenibacillus naphthalenovorans TaxID=162209 RepID=UPI003D26B958